MPVGQQYRGRPARQVQGGRVSNVSTTNNTTGISTGLQWRVEAGGVYKIEFDGSYTAGAATTGIQFALVRGSGTTLNSATLNVLAGAGTLTSEHSISTSTTDGFTNGANSGGATERPLKVDGMFVVSAGGNLALQVRSEVSGSAVTIVRGVGVLTRII